MKSILAGLGVLAVVLLTMSFYINPGVNTSKTRVRGHIDMPSQDTVRIQEWAFYIDGTTVPVDIGANDHLEIDEMFVSTSNGFTNVYFSDTTALLLPNRVFRSKIQENVTLSWATPMRGNDGYGLWGGNTGANAIQGTCWGWVYRGQ